MLKVDVARGADACALTGAPNFLAQWTALYERCPWATAFQAPAFALAWYAAYESRYEPLLIVGTGADGSLRALLTLAVDTATSHRLVVAGGPHAEYQAWLARPTDGSVFITEALAVLAGLFPAGSLRLQYVPPGAPLDWAAPGTRWGRVSDVRSHPRPLMAVGSGACAAASLRKSGNRSRLARLGRGGGLRFERLTEPAALAAAMPEIATFYDLRQGAVNGALPFRDDPRLAPFLLALADVPGLLHATVLRSGDALVSAHLGVAGRAQLSLGTIAHSPFRARDSPGKLHLLLLAGELDREGYTTCDLTPGGDAYKERFATHHDVVHVVEIFFSPAGFARHATATRVRQGVVRGTKRVLTPVGVDAVSARRLLRLAMRHGVAALPGKVARMVKRSVYDRREFRLYQMPADVARALPADRDFHRDHLADLLAYDAAAPEASYATLSAFLREALSRIADGLHVYTAVEGGVLVHYGWLTDRRERMFVTEVGHEVRLPLNSAVAWDDWTHPQARGRGMQARSVRQRLRDAAGAPGTSCIVCGLVATNGPSRHNMEKVGFRYWCSLFTEVRVGRTRRWSTCGDEGRSGPSA